MSGKIFKIFAVTIFLVLLFSVVSADNNLIGNEIINNPGELGIVPGEIDSADNPDADPFGLSGILTEKEKLSDSQEKLSTSLLRLVDRSYLPPSVSEDRFIAGMVESDQLIQSNGVDLVYVYIYLHPEFSTSVIEPYVNEIKGRDEEFHYAAAYVEVNELDSLASCDAVRFMMEVTPPVTNTGSVDSEGDTILKTENLRELTGLTGQGIKVGIISDGVDHILDSQSTGDLPLNVTVLRNTEGGDEGTAMLEIVHDMAPGSELYFHDCGANTIEFNGAIDALVDAGCDVICDDIGWITQPFFEDGSVASHVDEVLTNNDILYVSSGGNAANKHYQGDFYDMGNGYHDFSGGNSDYKYLYLDLPKYSAVLIILQWNDPFETSDNDYDLSLFDYYSGDKLAASTITQNGASSPLEVISTTYTDEDTIGVIAVNKYSGSSKNLELFVYSPPLYLDNRVTSDSVFGHSAVKDVISVGAIAASDPNYDTIESFSSLGPSTIWYPSYEQRNKPDITGIDGVSVTGAGGFSNPFYGTSASAPGIAGLLALTMDACPDKSPDEIKQALYSSADDLGDSGFDYTFGSGRANAIRLFDSLKTLPLAAFSANTTSGDSPLNVKFTDHSTGNPTTWLWDFGDGESSPAQHPEHTYNIADTYDVSLTVTNAYDSNTATKTDYITVQTTPITPPSVSTSSASSLGETSATLNGYLTSMGDTSSCMVYFQYGTTTSYGSTTQSHSMSSTDSFSQSITGLSPGTTYHCRAGASNSVETVYGLDVTFNTPSAISAPVSNFVASVTSGRAPLSVQLIDRSTGNPTSWHWEFGDNATSSDQDPTHTYQTEGTYDVTLNVSNTEGTDTLTKTEYISVTPLSVLSVDIPLALGWNMISIPVTDAELTIPSQVMDVVYMYDPAGQTYVAADITNFEPCKGYWVSATSPCTLSASGNGMECYAANLSPGWNMIGSVYENISFENCGAAPTGSVQNYAYSYDPLMQSYVSTTTLNPCCGYWVSAREYCTLDVGTNMSV